MITYFGYIGESQAAFILNIISGRSISAMSHFIGSKPSIRPKCKTHSEIQPIVNMRFEIFELIFKIFFRLGSMGFVRSRPINGPYNIDNSFATVRSICDMFSNYQKFALTTVPKKMLQKIFEFENEPRLKQMLSTHLCVPSSHSLISTQSPLD